VTAAPSRDYAETASPSVAASVTVLQPTIPGYRRDFLELLRERLSAPLTVLAGDDDFDPTVGLEGRRLPLVRVENVYLFRRKLLWQRHSLRPAVRAGTLVADLNPRILSTWIILMLRRALGRPSMLWGHAWPRGGQSARTDAVRRLMRRLADAVLPYTETEAAELRRRTPGRLVVAVPNALYPLATARDAASDGRAADFLYVGRLVEAKKPRLLLEAFLLALADLPPDACLVFVGDGPLRPALEEAASRAPGRVLFKGACTDFDTLRDLHAASLASVIPGYAGLSLIQSLWFGVPALIARQEPHSPEIEAAVDGVNTVFFKSDSVAALRDALVALVVERDLWIGRRREIARRCADRYSLDAMADAFVDALSAVRR
jgi:glycosyltransferase involved in cell wall biosynthesis